MRLFFYTFPLVPSRGSKNLSFVPSLSFFSCNPCFFYTFVMLKRDIEMFKKRLLLAFCHLCLVLAPLSSYQSLFADVMMFVYQKLTVAEYFLRSNILFLCLKFIHCISPFDSRNFCALNYDKNNTVPLLLMGFSRINLAFQIQCNFFHFLLMKICLPSLPNWSFRSILFIFCFSFSQYHKI